MKKNKKTKKEIYILVSYANLPHRILTINVTREVTASVLHEIYLTFLHAIKSYPFVSSSSFSKITL